MDWQKGKNWNFEAATSKVTAEELPFLYFVKPLKDKPGFLQLHRDIFPRPENSGKSSFLEFCKVVVAMPYIFKNLMKNHSISNISFQLVVNRLDR